MLIRIRKVDSIQVDSIQIQVDSIQIQVDSIQISRFKFVCAFDVTFDIEMLRKYPKARAILISHEKLS